MIECAQWISFLAKGPLYYLLLILWGLWLWTLRTPLPSQRTRFIQYKQLLFWSVGFFWTAGSVLNTALKGLIQAPRPWWIDSSCTPYSSSPSFSFAWPSGHAQSACGFFLLFFGIRILQEYRKPKLSSFFLIIIGGFCISWTLCVGWSRVILHAHSWFQVGCGWGIGALLVYLIHKKLMPSWNRFLHTPDLFLSRLRRVIRIGVLLGIGMLILFFFISPHYTPLWLERFEILNFSISSRLLTDSISSLFLWKPMLLLSIWLCLGWLLIHQAKPKKTLKRLSD